jgi:hypothetical protein
VNAPSSRSASELPAQKFTRRVSTIGAVGIDIPSGKIMLSAYEDKLSIPKVPRKTKHGRTSTNRSLPVFQNAYTRQNMIASPSKTCTISL